MAKSNYQNLNNPQKDFFEPHLQSSWESLLTSLYNPIGTTETQTNCWNKLFISAIIIFSNLKPGWLRKNWELHRAASHFVFSIPWFDLYSSGWLRWVSNKLLTPTLMTYDHFQNFQLTILIMGWFSKHLSLTQWMSNNRCTCCISKAPMTKHPMYDTD